MSNGVVLAERNAHMASLIGVAAELIDYARSLMPIVKSTQLGQLSESDKVCMRLEEIEQELRGFHDLMMVVVDEFYGR
jgi:hypothetical protein